MIVVRDQQLRLMLLAHLIRELQVAAQDHGPVPEGFSAASMHLLLILQLLAVSGAEGNAG